MKKTHFIVIIIIAVIILCSAFYFFSHDENISELGMEIPPDEMFLNAPSAELCENFDILFTYNDTSTPIYLGSVGEMQQKIIWNLYVTPKAGIEAKDFYCTLVLNDWILSKIKYPLPHMGVPKNMAQDTPSETAELHSMLEKFIGAEITQSPEYEEHIKASVNIMLSFDGRKEYYKVSPKFQEFKGTTE